MEEGEYKSTYNELADIRCIFEKALLSHQGKQLATCRLSRHFCLADREGYACENSESSLKCGEFLKIAREKSSFVLKLLDVKSPLPHNMEIRVQVGGLLGLEKALNTNAEISLEIDGISKILDQAEKQYGKLDELPYGEIIQSVVQFQGRQRRQR